MKGSKFRWLLLLSTWLITGIIRAEPLIEKLGEIKIGEIVKLGKFNLTITFLWWKESKIAVFGPYSGKAYYTFTAKPGMKFIILAYKIQNNWIREQTTPYLEAGEILTAPKGYYYKVFTPPVGIHSHEYKPREAKDEEISTLIGDPGAYKTILPEEFVVGRVVFEIPEDAWPIEAKIAHLPYLIKFK
jgi:hypothetical protein